MLTSGILASSAGRKYSYDSLELKPLYERKNINFMWIAGDNKPDFRTINRFRLNMRDIIEDVFYEVIKLLIEKKCIKLQNYFWDGTKIEATANKYTFKVCSVFLSSLSYDNKAAGIFCSYLYKR